jgi:hypothetical protein
MDERRLLRSDPLLRSKAAFFEAFWNGEGSCPILFAKPHLALGRNYLVHDLVQQHADVEKLLAEALAQVRAATDRSDDGIPVARADLGTTLFPSGLGLRMSLSKNAHPWLAEHLDLARYVGLDAPLDGLAGRGEFPLAAAFYRRLREERQAGRLPAPVMPYVPDNQGVFDLTHLVVGSDVFYAVADDPSTLLAAQERSLELFLAGSRWFKDLIGEEAGSMVHGHGMPSGVWFPDTGIRVSEDSCTLISVADIRRYCLPFIERAIRPFGRGFLHFCGRHEDFLRMAVEHPLVSTVNLGNPELYDLEEVFSWCGRTGTVFFGHVARAGGEDDEAWLERLAGMCGRTGCRLILVAADATDAATDRAADAGVGTPAAVPSCERFVQRWHELTRPSARRGRR